MNLNMGEGIKFERIRRITGYLVGTMDKWNDAKKAEERDRVKHAVRLRENRTDWQTDSTDNIQNALHVD